MHTTTVSSVLEYKCCDSICLSCSTVTPQYFLCTVWQKQRYSVNLLPDLADLAPLAYYFPLSLIFHRQNPISH